MTKGSRIAITSFESANDNLSNFILEELTGAMFDRGIEVADRQNLAYIYQEFDFQMSGNVSDETIQSIGKILASQLVITGQLTNIGNTYRYQLNTVNVDKGTQESITLEVRNDQAMKRMVTAIANQKTSTIAAKYGVSEDTTPKSAGRFLDRGILFASRKEFTKAIADFTDAIKINPNMSASYMFRGIAVHASVLRVDVIETDLSDVTFYMTGDDIWSGWFNDTYVSAQKDFTEALRLDPNNTKGNNARIYVARGNTYIDQTHPFPGIEDYGRAIASDPNYALAYCERGHAFALTNEFDKALNDFNKAIALNPNHAKTYYYRGKAYSDKNNINMAIVDYTQAEKLNASFIGMYNEWGVLYFDRHEWDNAIAKYSRAIKLAPDFYGLYNNRGNAYGRKGDYNKALADYNQAIKLKPDHARSYTNRGYLHYEKGYYDLAIADCTQAIKINPSYVDAYNWLGASFVGKREYDKALENYNQAIRLIGNNSSLYNNRGIAYRNKGDFERAIADYT